MKRILLILFLIAAAAMTQAADSGTLLLRFPDIHGDQVVFSYAGNLYTVSTQGASHAA